MVLTFQKDYPHWMIRFIPISKGADKVVFSKVQTRQLAKARKFPRPLRLSLARHTSENCGV